MRNKNKQPDNHIAYFAPKILYVIIGLLSLQLIAASVSLWRVRVQISTELSVALLPIHAQPQLVKTSSDWKTYMNSQYGFSFEYPKAWKLSDCYATTIIVNGVCDSDSSYNVLINIISGNEVATEIKPFEAIKFSNISIDKFSAKKFQSEVASEGPGNPDGSKEQDIFFYDGKNTYHIELIQFPKEDNKQFFEQILSSFKITTPWAKSDTTGPDNCATRGECMLQ